jgi:very-short-patch-repair endonuclease
MAAMLACGDGAAVSHRSSGVIADFVGMLSRPRIVDISIARGWRAPSFGVRVHRVARLAPDEVTVVDGIRVTTPARTLLDLATCLSAGELEQALARAHRRAVVTPEAIDALLPRYARRRGRRLFDRYVAEHSAPAFTRSEAEARFLRLVRRARLPQPAANTRFRGYELDFLWRDERVVVEVDGMAFHGSRGAFEADRLRDGVLAAAGLRVMRITWRQLVAEPEALVVRIGQALAISAAQHELAGAGGSSGAPGDAGRA